MPIRDKQRDKLDDRFLPPYAEQYGFSRIREDAIHYLILKEEDKKTNKFNLELFIYYHDIKNFLDHSFLLDYPDFEWVLCHYYSEGLLNRIKQSLLLKEAVRRTKDKEAVSFMILFGINFLNDTLYNIAYKLNLTMGVVTKLENWMLERLEKRYDLYILHMFMCRLMIQLIIDKSVKWAEENSVARL